jgi:hypothetical protein
MANIDEMTDEELKEAIKRFPTDKLKIFRELFTNIVREAKQNGDERVIRPQRQLKAVVELINEREELDPPTDQSITMDSLSLASEFNSQGE